MENALTQIAHDEETAEVVTEEEKVTSVEETAGQVAFEGNAYDLTALIGLISGAIVLLTCLTCGIGLYILPIFAIILGVIGIVMAKKSVNPQRTQLWSWLGIGTSAVIILLGLFGFAVYIILIIGYVKASGY